VTEEFAFQEPFRNGPAVHGDDGPAGTGAQMVDQAGNQFLAGAAFALQQNRRPAGGNAAGHIENRIHFRAAVDDAVRGDPLFAELFTEQLVLPEQGPPLGHPVDEEEKLFELDGLGDVIQGARLHRIHGRFDGPIGRDDDDVDLRVDAFHFLEDRHAVHARHLVIQQKKIEMTGPHFFQGPFAVFRLRHGMSFLDEEVAKHLPLGFSVFNDQNLQFFHRPFPVGRLSAPVPAVFSAARSEGKKISKVVPSPALLVTRISPPWPRTIS